MRRMALVSVLVAAWMATVAAAPGQTTKPSSSADAAQPVVRATTQPAVAAAPKAEPTTQPASGVAAAERATTQPAQAAATPTTQPAQATAARQPTTQPAAVAARPQPDTHPAPQKVVRNIRFQYKDMPFVTVIGMFAREANKPIIGELNVEGNLTFFDSQMYSYTEAMDMLNLFLAMRGHHLREDGRFLRLEQISTAPAWARILRSPEAATAGDVRPAEIVTMVVPLKFVDVDSVKNAVVRMISPWGQIAPLAGGRGLVITDKLDRIEYVRSFLELLDTEKLTKYQMRTHALKTASAADVAKVIDDLFGPRAIVRLKRSMGYQGRIDTSEAVSTTVDSRSNTIFLMGSGERLEMAENLLTQLDKEDRESREMRIFQIKNAKAEDLVKIITPALPSVQVAQRGRPPQSVPVARVVADPASNRLIVSGPVESIADIEKMIKDLDKASEDTGGMKIFRLKHADAQQLAGIIRNATSTTTADRRGRRQSTVNVSADSRTNRLVIIGSRSDVELAAKLVAEFDEPPPAEGAPQAEAREIQVVHLEGSDARQLAQALRRLFEASGGTSMRVEPEPGSNSLIISAVPGDWPRIRDILEKLKANVAPLSVAATRKVPVNHVKADELARSLRQIYDARGRQRRGGAQQVPVVIAVAPTNDSLLISAAADDQKTIAELIKSLDVDTEESHPIRTVFLQAADPEKVAASLRAMMPEARGRGASVVIQADRLSKSVWVRAPQDKWEQIEQIIAKLDEQSRQWTREMRQLPLKNASAQALVATLGQLYQRYVSSGRGGRGGDPAEQIVLAAGPGDRTLLIEGPKSKIQEIVTLAQSMDVAGVGGLQVRTYQLTHSDAREMARSLGRLFSEQRRGPREAGELQPRFEADTVTNQLLIAAPGGQFDDIEALIKQLQAATVLASKTETFALKFAKANELAPILQNMLTERGRGRSGGYPVRVAAMQGANALIIQGLPEKLALAKDLIAKFDKAEYTDDATVRIIRLKNAKAEDMLAKIRGLLPRGMRDVSVQADKATNSLLIVAPKAQRQELEKTIAQIDQATEPLDREMRTIKLQHASASSLVSMLSQLYPSQQRGRRGPPADPEEQVVVTAAPNDRSLVIEAPRKKIEEIAQLVASMDTKAEAEQQTVRMYQLTGANAYEASRSLNRLYSQGGRGRGKAAETPPRFEYDYITNQLLVSATDAQFEEIEPLIKRFTEASPDSQTQTYKLKFARAGEVAPILQSMLYDQRSGRAGAAQVPTRVAVMQNVNAIVIQGPGEKHALAKNLLKELDQPYLVGESEVRVIQLRNAQATDVANVLRGMIPRPKRGVAEEVRIQAEWRTNSILLSAPQAQREELEKLIAELDKSAVEAREVRIVAMEHMSAWAVTETLRQMYQWGPSGRGRPGSDSERVVITATPDDRSVVIDAPRTKVDQIVQMAGKLDTVEGGTQREVRTYQIVGASVWDVARSLGNLFRADRRQGRAAPTQPEPRFEADGATNQLLVSAVPADFARIEKVLEQYKSDALRSETRTFELKFARASEIVGLLNSMLQESGMGYRGYRGTIPTRIAALPGANAVIVQGTPDKLKQAEDLIAKFDTAQATKDSLIRIVKVVNADAEALANTLRQMVGSGRGRERDVLVQADRLTNSILLRGPEAQRASIEAMIAQLDANSAAAREIRTIRLKNASASQLEWTLNRMDWSPRMRGGSRGADPTERVTITAAADDRTLIVDAPRKKIEQIAQLVATMDEEDSSKVQVRTYQLTNANAAEVARTLGRLFAQSRRQGRQASAEPDARFESDSATNQLIVSASPTQFQEIEKVIEKVEKAVLASQTKTYELKFARAREILPVIQEMLSPDRSRRAAGQTPARVAVVPGSNSLILQGPPDKIALAERLIQTFDTEKFAPQTGVQIVRLANAQADTLARSINDTLSRGARGRDPAERVTVTAEINSNSLLVSGPADAMPEVVKMIKEVDADSTASDVQVQMFRLINSDAQEMADAIGRFFRDTIQQQARLRRGAQSPPFTVGADTRTNTLVVCTTSGHFAMVRKLVQDLDKAEQRPLQDMRYISLRSADAWDVAYKISAMYKDRRGADKPVVEADFFTNAVTVIAKAEDLKTIEPMIVKMDEVAERTNIQIRVIPLAKVRAEKMAETIQRLYGPMTTSEIKITDKLPERPPTVPDPRGAGLLFPSIAPEGVDDANAAAATSVKPTPSTKPAAAAAATTQPAGDDDLPERPPITIAVDRSANALIISGTRSEIANIESMIERLAAGSDDARAEFRIFKLKEADPVYIARTLDELFNPQVNRLLQQLQRQRQQQPQPQPRDQRGRRAQVPVPAAVETPPQISVVADPANRSVIVRAKPVDFDLIEKLIEQLDQRATVVSEVRVFVLKNTDATEVADNLKQLFRQASTAAAAPAARQGRQRVVPQQQRVEMIRQLMELRRADGTVQVDVSSVLSVAANRQTNSVVVAAPADAMELIAKIIQDLDQSAGEATQPVVRLYPLKNAEVRSTVQALQEIFVAPSRQGARGARGQSAAGQVVVTADEAGRTVIVAAPSEKQELIAKVIKDIDERLDIAKLTVQVYRLVNAEATSVAQALFGALGESAAAMGRGRQAAAQGGGTVRIMADRSSNTVVVRASEEDHARIGKLIAEMDAAPFEGRQVRVIPLNHAEATEVARSLRNLFAAQAAGRGRGPAPAVVIEASRDSRMLMVRADEETFNKIRALVAQMDTTLIGKSVRVVIPLKNAQAATLAPALMQAFAPPRGRSVSPDELVTVVAEPTVNAVVVTASEDNAKLVQELAAKLDSEATGLRTEMILLKNAKAADLADTLSRIVATRGRGRGQQPGVSVSAEPSSNALLMSGPAGELDKLMAMAMQLDQVPPEQTAGVYVIPLEKGYASDVAKMVQALYRPLEQAARQQRRSIDPLAVSADERSNAIVLATTKTMYEQVLKWVKEVEDLQPKRDRMRIITVEHADPEDVQKAIDQLFGGGGSSQIRGAPAARQPPRAQPGPGASRGKVETTVLPNQRAIMVSASEEDYEAIKKLVAEMEAAALKTKRQVRVFAVKNTTNTRVADALRTTYVAVRGARPEDRVSVTALPQTDAVVVSAAKERMEEIAHLIEQLDKPEIAPDFQIRVYPLTNAQPTKLLPLLRNMLRQIQRMRPGEPIDLQADERTRSIIVSARGLVFDQIEKIIQTLDKPAPKEIGTAEVLIIPLKNADATRLALVLTEMLRPSTTGQATEQARALQEQIRLLRVRGALAEKIPELDLTKPIKITADPTQDGRQGSNSLLIMSTADNLKAMRAIVEMLDKVPLAEGAKVRLVHLKNADASSVRTILEDIFNKGRRLAGREGSTVAGRAEPESATGKALVNPLGVSVDVRTNLVILSGMEESLALAELICKDLDRQNGKLVTEVRLFRLKHADARRLAPLLQAVFAEGRAVAGAEGLQTQVTRLKTVLAKQQGHATEIPKTHEALAIQADETTNILVVAARKDVMPLIADVIGTMDVPGAGTLNTVRMFPLINADASRIQQVVNTLYTGPNARFIRDEDKPTVAVDTRTNALVVSASESTFAMLDVLLRQLDAKQAVDVRDIRLIPLKNADAVGLAATVQRMMDARVQRQQSLGVRDAEALRVVIAADARSNALIVGGSAESFQLVKGLAEQLDGASSALSGQIQLLPLKEANAGTLSAILTNLFNQRYQAARTPDVQRQRPVILPDLRTNSLLVAANQDDSKVLASLLAKMDVKLVDPAVKLVVLPLKHNDAGIVGPMIQQIFAARLQSMTPPGQTPAPQDRVNVEIEALSNALVVSASKENLELIGALLAKVDVEPPMETGLVRMYMLKNSDAQRVATMLRNLLTQGLYKPGLSAAGRSAALAAREKVAITVDIRTNVLIVSASKENFAVLEEIIKKIDAADAYSVLGDIRVYTLKYADATRLAPTLQQFYNAKRAAEQAAGDTGRSLPVSITADARTNSLLIAGSIESFKSVDAMLAKLDAKEVLSATAFKVFELKHASAAKLQATIQQLFNQRPTRGAAREPVTIIADAQANSLVVGASPEDMKTAEALIERLDVEPTEAGKTVQVFPLRKADATRVANTLRSLYQAQGAAAGVTISVDERINAVVVTGGQAELKRVEEIVRQLDTEAVTRVTEIRVFTLKNADATEMAQIITDSLTNPLRSRTPLSPNRQTILQFVTQTQEGKQLMASALQEGVLITPDRRTNSLVVSAPIENMPLLESLVKAMDSTTPRMAEIRTFTLKNADAAQMADVLRELFRLAGAPADTRAVSYTLVTTRPAEGAKPSATLGTAEQYALSVTVDSRTNTLLIGGTKRYVELAATVIDELDASPAQERQTKVYRLRNARATDIQTALRTFLDQERQRLLQALGNDRLGAAQRLLEREVAVVAVPSEGDPEKTNTLLLSASPRYFKIVQQMIEELDQTPPQVLVQVLLAEVTLDDTTNIGLEWSYTRTDGKWTEGVGTSYGLRADFANFGGFNVSVTGSELSFFLRALQDAGRLEVLSRPQVLASDNQLARINVGQRVPFISNSRVTEDGTVINTIEYRDVGIVLEVTPRISQDNFVKLQVRPEISSVATSTVPLSTGLNAALFNTREAETTVTVQDGHTIVLGGLITTKDENREKKVPLLGDIPWLGNLFKSTKKVKERSELLIIMTPRIIATPAAADRTTEDESRRLKLLRSIERDAGTKDTLFTPLELLVGQPTGPQTRPYVEPKELVPSLRRENERRGPTSRPVENEYNRPSGSKTLEEEYK